MSLGLVVFAYVMALASSNKHNMIIKAANEYSKPIENFAYLLKAAVNNSNCCNVFTSGESTMSKNMLKEFVQVYPHTYTLNYISNYCSGYLIISTSVDGLIAEMKSVPTANPTTELLILFDKSVAESMKLFNTSMYDMANVIVATPNGLWTLHHDFPVQAFFKKVSSYREITRRGNIVNLQGRELIATAFHRPPYSYLQSKENRTVKGLKGEYYISKNESEFDGIEVKLLMLIAERLNFTWAISSIKDDEILKYGYANGSEWSGGIIGKLFNKEADIAFTNVWFIESKYQYINLTTPWGVVGQSFLVPRPRPYTSFWALTRPLSHSVWSAVTAMLIIQSIYVYTKAWQSPKISKRFRNFVITLTELMGILVGMYQPTRLQGLRLQLQLWSFIGTLLVTAYSSSLAANLANRLYEKRIDTARDFVEANLTWGNSEFIPSMKLLFDESDSYGGHFIKRFEHEKSDTDKHRKIIQRKYAIIGARIFSIFIPEVAVTDEDLKGFRLMKNSVVNVASTFAVQPWLLESLDTVTLRLQQAGVVQYIVKDVLRRRTGRILREVLVEHDGPVIGPRKLHLVPLGAGFMVLIVGLFISTVVFYFELRPTYSVRSFRHQLLRKKIRHMASSAKALKRKWDPRRFIVFLKVFFFSVFYIFSSVKKVASVIPDD